MMRPTTPPEVTRTNLLPPGKMGLSHRAQSVGRIPSAQGGGAAAGVPGSLNPPIFSSHPPRYEGGLAHSEEESAKHEGLSRNDLGHGGRGPHRPGGARGARRQP